MSQILVKKRLESFFFNMEWTALNVLREDTSDVASDDFKWATAVDIDSTRLVAQLCTSFRKRANL